MNLVWFILCSTAHARQLSNQIRSTDSFRSCLRQPSFCKPYVMNLSAGITFFFKLSIFDAAYILPSKSFSYTSYATESTGAIWTCVLCAKQLMHIAIYVVKCVRLQFASYVLLLLRSYITTTAHHDTSNHSARRTAFEAVCGNTRSPNTENCIWIVYISIYNSFLEFIFISM